jgi:serine/threonine protein kinase
MAHTEPIDLDVKSPPFDKFKSIRRLSPDRSGHASTEHARNQLYIGRYPGHQGSVLIKVTSKPGLVYEHDIANEIAALSRINRELASSKYFPMLQEHGRLRDGRVFLTATLFDELPLATVIGQERVPAKTVAYLRTAIEITKALGELHGIGICHVDLNPMNVLYRSESGRPVIRIVDFESSYEPARHTAGVFYNPPTTAGFTAPEVANQPPDPRCDLFSSGAVLYTMLAGYEWTWKCDVDAAIKEDRHLDPALREILLTAVDRRLPKRYQTSQDLQTALTTYLESIWPGRSW